MYASITNVLEFLKWRSFRQPQGLAAVAAIAAIGPGTRGRLCSQLSSRGASCGIQDHVS